MVALSLSCFMVKTGHETIKTTKKKCKDEILVPNKYLYLIFHALVILTGRGEFDWKDVCQQANIVE